jgi:hypothetical protein
MPHRSEQLPRRPSTEASSPPEQEPEFEVSVFLSGHDTAADIERLKPLLAQADVYVPEAYGHDGEHTIALYDEIMSDPGIAALGEMGIDLPTAQLQEAVWLAGQPKVIMLADVPRNSKEYGYMEQSDYLIHELLVRATHEFYQGNTQAAVQLASEAYDFAAEALERHNNFMRKSLQAQLPDLIARHPALADKHPLRVLMTLGLAHTDVGQPMGEQITTKKYYGNSLNIFSKHDEIIRRKMKHLPVSEHLYVQTIIEACLLEQTDTLLDQLPTVNERNLARRLLLEQITPAMIPPLEQRLQTQHKPDEMGETVIAVLTAQGVQIPRTLQELQTLLDSYPHRGRMSRSVAAE